MKLLLTILVFSSSIISGQSSIEIEDYLTANWVSAASIVTGDTTAMNKEDEKLFLQTDNDFTMIKVTYSDMLSVHDTQHN